VFHHGTARREGQLVTARGRVLAVTAVGPDLPTALQNTYAGVDKICFDGAHYRRDIGRDWQVVPMPMMPYPIGRLPQTSVQSQAI
jgi:phosphoribosylamine--glycine ligase